MKVIFLILCLVASAEAGTNLKQQDFSSPQNFPDGIIFSTASATGQDANGYSITTSSSIATKCIKFSDNSQQCVAASGTSTSVESNTFIGSSKTFTGGILASSMTLTSAETNLTVSSNIVLAGGAIRFPDGSLQVTAATSGGGGSTVHVAFASTTFVGSQATTGSALACISGATVTFVIANSGDPIYLSSDISWSGSTATNYVGLGFMVDGAVITGENTSFGVAIFDTLTLLPRQNNTAVGTSQALSAGFHSACLAWSYSAGTATHINGQTDIFSVFEIQK